MQNCVGDSDRSAQAVLRELQMGWLVGGSVRILSPATSFRKKPLGENGGGSTWTTEAGESSCPRYVRAPSGYSWLDFYNSRARVTMVSVAGR
jgi:hypothetical protein